MEGDKVRNDLTHDEKSAVSAMAGWKRPSDAISIPIAAKNNVNDSKSSIHPHPGTDMNSASNMCSTHIVLNVNGTGSYDLGHQYNPPGGGDATYNPVFAQDISAPVSDSADCCDEPKAKSQKIHHHNVQLQQQQQHKICATGTAAGGGTVSHVPGAGAGAGGHAGMPSQPQSAHVLPSQPSPASASAAGSLTSAPGMPSFPVQMQGMNLAQSSQAQGPNELRPSPFFYYRDHSTDIDDDPLTPLTPLTRVPNFPAKMHAILSRPDLSDVVTWMNHGRSWRVLKPREFEIRVIPTYFEHQKFSSFIRQANGWGFRRVTKGKDRNSYYHELFLRGLPHLCKKMKRPGVSKKASVDADHEPNFYEISSMFPVPEKARVDDSANIHMMLPSRLMAMAGKTPSEDVMCTAHSSAMTMTPAYQYNHYGTHSYNDDGNSSGTNISTESGATVTDAKCAASAAAASYVHGPLKPPPNTTMNVFHNGAEHAVNSNISHDPRPQFQPPQQQHQHQQPTHLIPTTAASAPVSSSSVPLQAMTSMTKLPATTTMQHQQPIPPAHHQQQQSLPPPQQKQQQHQQVVHQSPSYSNQQAFAVQHALSALASQHLQMTTAKTAPPPPLQQQQQYQYPTASFQQHAVAAAAAMASDPTSQFAAGFAAATALNNPHFQFVLNQALAAGTAVSAHSNASATTMTPTLNAPTAVLASNHAPNTAPTCHAGDSGAVQIPVQVPFVMNHHVNPNGACPAVAATNQINTGNAHMNTGVAAQTYQSGTLIQPNATQSIFHKHNTN